MAEKEENEESELEKNSTMMEVKYKNHLVGSRINFYENKTRSDMLHKPEEPRVSKSKIPDVLLLDAGRSMEQEGEETNIKKEIAATNTCISKRNILSTHLTQKPQYVGQEAAETSSEKLVAGDSDSGSESAFDFNFTAEHIYFSPDFENSNITDRKSFSSESGDTDDISQGDKYVHSNSSRFGSFNASDNELQFQRKIALYDIGQKSEKEMIKIESVVSDGLEMVNEGIADGISEIHNQIDEAENRLKHIYSKIDLQGDDTFRNSLRKTGGLIKPKKSGRPSILNIFNQARLDEDQAKSDVDPDRHNEEMGKLRNRLAEYYLDRFDSVPLSSISPEHDQKLTALYVCPEIRRQKVSQKDKDYSEKVHVDKYKTIFFPNGIQASNIYLQGDSGSGKSTFCNKLVIEWSNYHILNKRDSQPFPTDENCFTDINIIKDYKFLFYLDLSEPTSECSIEKLIRHQFCYELYPEKDQQKAYELLQHVLEQEKCLIILDGFEEWTHPNILQSNCRCRKHDRSEPWRDRGWKKSTILTTCRPWILAAIQVKDSKIDILLEISWVLDKRRLVERVLFCLTQDVSEHIIDKCCAYIKRKIFDENMSVPIFIIQLVCLWYFGKPESDSSCEVYVNLFSVLEARFQDGHVPTTETSNSNRSHGAQFDRGTLLGDVWLPLAKAAFELLFSTPPQISVIFEKEMALKYLNETDIRHALKLGILRERKDFSLLKRRSHISFVHRTFQEFLAACHLARNPDLFATFVKPFISQSKENSGPFEIQ